MLMEENLKIPILDRNTAMSHVKWVAFHRSPQALHDRYFVLIILSILMIHFPRLIRISSHECYELRKKRQVSSHLEDA